MTAQARDVAAMPAALASLVRQYLDGSGAPAAVAAVTDRAGTLWVGGFGEPAWNGPAEHARFQIGSISKPLTAALALQAEACGQVRLAQPAADFLPLCRAPGLDAITLEQLLTHTSGLSIGSVAAPWSEWDLYLARKLPRVYPAGGQPYYSNLGYNLLGEALAAACNAPLRTLLQQHVFAPLGMQESVGEIAAGAQAGTVPGCMPDPMFAQHWLGQPLVAAPWEPTAGAAGCVLSSAADLARFLRHLLAAADDASLPWSRLLEPRANFEGDLWYGYGMFLDLRAQRRRFFHAGGMLGHRCLMMGDPGTGLGVVVLTNLGGPQRGSLILKLGHAMLDSAREALATGTTEPGAAVAYGVEDVERWRGVYRAADGAGLPDLQLEVVDRRLVLQHAGQAYPVQWVEDDRFISRCPGWTEFEFTLRVEPGGAEPSLRYGAARLLPARQPRAPAVAPSLEASALAGSYRSRNGWAPLVQVSQADGGLMVHVGHMAARLLPIGELAFQVEASPEILVFGAPYEGRMLQLELSGCLYHRCRD